MRSAPILTAVGILLVAAVAACTPPPPPGVAYPILCPVKGTVSFTNDWHAPRAGGLVHEGNDVFAARGRPNVAVTSGVLSRRVGARSGYAAWLVGDDGNEYFYAHFSSWAGGDRRVVAGEVIGYTGDTGDAFGTAPHTHFEVHPKGVNGAVNPYPSLVAACTDRSGVSASSQPEGDVPSAADDGLER